MKPARQVVDRLLEASSDEEIQSNPKEWLKRTLSIRKLDDLWRRLQDFMGYTITQEWESDYENGGEPYPDEPKTIAIKHVNVPHDHRVAVISIEPFVAFDRRVRGIPAEHRCRRVLHRDDLHNARAVAAVISLRSPYAKPAINVVLRYADGGFNESLPIYRFPFPSQALLPFIAALEQGLTTDESFFDLKQRLTQWDLSKLE